MKHRLFFVLVFLIIRPPLAAVAETLEDAWIDALAHDGRIQSAEATVMAAHEDLLAARALRYPSLNARAAFTVFDKGPATSVSLPLLPTLTFPLLEDDRVLASRLSVSVPVITFGKISGTVKASASAERATRADAARTVQDIKLQVAEAYVAVLRARDALAVTRSNVAALSAHGEDTRRAFDQGLVPENDVLAVTVALAQALQLELRAKNAVDLSSAAYNRLLGRPLTEEPVLADLLPGPDHPDEAACQTLIDRALSLRPELRGLSDQAEAFAHKAGSIRASALPQVMIGGSLCRMDQTLLDDDTFWMGTVGLSWDLFDGGVIRHRARSEDRKRLAAEHRLRDARSLISLQVRQAFLDLREARLRITVTEGALDQSEENLAITKNRYARDIGSNTEVLDAETARLTSRINHTSAVYDAVLADLRLKRATGEL
ncbi:TolC family protein [Desulfatiferula olefinivorans]